MRGRPSNFKNFGGGPPSNRRRGISRSARSSSDGARKSLRGRRGGAGGAGGAGRSRQFRATGRSGSCSRENSRAARSSGQCPSRAGVGGAVRRRGRRVSPATLDSFLLNHSLEYTVAALSSWIEFTLENIFWPELKQITWLSTMGLLMVVFGECLRKAAMFTAGSNFNHVVQNEKSDTHTLVTSGVYAWFRHPSYVGWFYWSIGTQVMLCNPICGVVYALTVWRFFRDRTEEEEISLIHFFGEEYLEYKKRVPTGLPFIKGVKVEL
uniref:protein-S-isoprenylcysteine O-methyltransferase n=1 Tax=Urocitellus parryii TaxID=9999 RepID=UPI000E558CFD|nr:protein-S-isoprenylcysteine O-methyltransferase [Urocitellus parryii]